MSFFTIFCVYISVEGTYRATGLFDISRELTNLIAKTETIKFIRCTKIEYNTGIAAAHVIDVPALQKFGKSNINIVGKTIFTIRKNINNCFASGWNNLIFHMRLKLSDMLQSVTIIIAGSNKNSLDASAKSLLSGFTER